MTIVLEVVEAPTDEARALIQELEAELSGLYAAEQRHGYSIERVFQPNILFFVARLDGQVVGCGGVAIEEDFAELKRMYVRPGMRGRHVGQAILARLEEEARRRGMRRLALETGDVSHVAIRLYEGAGFQACAAFGAYAGMAPEAIERSVFFEKQIG